MKKLTGLSNSRLESQKLGFKKKERGERVEIFDCFIDKLTIVGNLDIDLAYALQNLTNEPHVYVDGLPTVGAIKGQFFNYGYDESVYFSYDSVNSKAMGKRNFRMEFNPRKISVEQEKWLKDKVIYLLDDIGFSRVDIASDCDFDLSEYTFTTYQACKSGFWYGLDGKMETMYLGSRSSDVFRRVYNKRAEVENANKKINGANEKAILRNLLLPLDQQIPLLIPNPIERETWWRFEYELKHSTSLDELIAFNLPLFNDLRVFKPNYDNLSVNDSLALIGLEKRPDLFAKLSKNTRSKYRKIMREMQADVDITSLFKETLQKKSPELVAELNSWRR